jgi:hypothetical protein
MSVSANVACYLSPLIYHGVQIGYRWSGLKTSLAGDASAGTATCNFLPPSIPQIAYSILDFIYVDTNNAATDMCQWNTGAFDDVVAFSRPIVGGLLNNKTDTALWQLPQLFLPRPFYLGRLGNGASMIYCIISPNTNAKAYNFAAAGRLLFDQADCGI